MSVVDSPPAAAFSPFVAAAVGVGDPGSSRLVYAMVIGLVVVGVALIGLAVWILRQTRPDLEVLAPLERMGDGDWKQRDPSTQRRMLDEVRPQGAEPLASEPLAPPLDDDFEQGDHPVTSFSDLGPGLGDLALEPESAEADLAVDEHDDEHDDDEADAAAEVEAEFESDGDADDEADDEADDSAELDEAVEADDGVEDDAGEDDVGLDDAVSDQRG